MGQDARHIGTGKSIGQKGQHHAEHRLAYGPPRRFQDQQNTYAAYDEVSRRHRTGTQHELLVFQDDVGRRSRPQDSQQDIQRMDLAAFYPLFPRRIEQKYQRHAKAQMYSALQLGIEHAERTGIQLKYGKRNGNGRNNFGHKSLVVYRIGFIIIFFQHLIGELFRRFFTHISLSLT